MDDTKKQEEEGDDNINDRSSVWKLYVSRALTSWGDRLWSFGLGLLLFRIFPENLRVIAAYGITNSLVSIISGSVIGSWIDNNHRLKAAKVFLLIQNSFVTLDCTIFSIYYFFTQEIVDSLGEWIKILMIIVTILLSLIANMASAGSKIVIEKDWIVVIAAGDEDRLARLNSIFRTIDLVCFSVAPVLAGLFFQYSGYAITAVTIALWNIVSVLCEYYLLIAIYQQFPDLGNKQVSDESKSTSVRSKMKQVTGSYDGWQYYFQHKIRSAGLGLAFLFMTVLGFDTTTWAYSLMQCVPESVLGALVAVSAVFGVAGALSFPHLRRWTGAAERVGVLGMVWLVTSLSMCVVSVWLPGSPFDINKDIFNDTTFAEDATIEEPVFTVSNNLTDDAISRRCALSPPDLTSVSVLLSGIIAARTGLWLADLSINQILQENVEEKKRGTVGGVQSSLNSSFNLLKFCLVLIMPMENMFGLLVILSFIFICFGALSMSYYSVQENKLCSSCYNHDYSPTNTEDDGVRDQDIQQQRTIYLH